MKEESIFGASHHWTVLLSVQLIKMKNGIMDPDILLVLEDASQTFVYSDEISP
jgi:hypothetical protein